MTTKQKIAAISVAVFMLAFGFVLGRGKAVESNIVNASHEDAPGIVSVQPIDPEWNENTRSTSQPEMLAYCRNLINSTNSISNSNTTNTSVTSSNISQSNTSDSSGGIFGSYRNSRKGIHDGFSFDDTNMWDD